MTRVEASISAALANIETEGEEDRRREQYRQAMCVLGTIPNGRADADLTAEQRAAWRDHDEALGWFKGARA